MIITCLVIQVVHRLPVLTLLMIPYQDLRPVEVKPGPQEAGVGDLEAGPGTRGYIATEAGVGRRKQLLAPHASVGLGKSLGVHDHGPIIFIILPHFTADCLTHSSLVSHLCSVSIYLCVSVSAT